jgi:hypothetical protein
VSLLVWYVVQKYPDKVNWRSVEAGELCESPFIKLHNRRALYSKNMEGFFTCF